MLSENDIIFHGHTHRYRLEKNNETIIFNPGECAGILKGKNQNMAEEKNEKKETKSSVENVGTSEFQITVFTNRIKNLTDHLKVNKKDHNTRRGLMKLVGKRRKILSYLKKKSVNRYDSIIKSLGLRR